MILKNMIRYQDINLLQIDIISADKVLTINGSRKILSKFKNLDKWKIEF